MATKIVKYQDPRTVLPDPPTFGVPITAMAINNYRLPASALSNTSIAFNNLVVLGKNQMYSNTFQVETEFEITMKTTGQAPKYVHCPDICRSMRARPFPFASVTDQVRVNLNGTVLSSPVAYTLPARLQYMDQDALIESYMNECACVIPKNHQETGFSTRADANIFGLAPYYNGRSLFRSLVLGGTQQTESVTEYFLVEGSNSHPIYQRYNLCNEVMNGITSKGIPDSSTNDQVHTVTFKYTTTEPIFCSPFASRLDANYGSPITGIQSLDINFTLNDLRRAFLMYLPYVDPTSFSVNITKCTLLYDVISTIPDPTTAIVGPTYYPYRIIEPYITDYPSNPLPNQRAATSGTITSGVYTLTRVPTAIWVWIGPTKGVMQHFQTQALTESPSTTGLYSAENDYFGAIDHINITMGNTTQILNNASVLDLYRTSKANGCQLTFKDFSGSFTSPNLSYEVRGTTSLDDATIKRDHSLSPGPGTVLRLVPGLDLIMSDRDLVPGSACENVVFQLTANFRWLLNSETPGAFNRNIALWLGFEYTGVIEINNGTATLNTAPISVPAAKAAPVLRVASENIPARAFLAEGGSFFDKIWSGIKTGVRWLKNNKMISKIAKSIPHPIAQTVGSVADDLGFGYGPVCKRSRYDSDDDLEGGAIMGLGDFT